ncbi:helix-turn-helix domain-containing protein [Corynebacterium stationis]|uniref:helix-turn-helix domain-containing protein n=1 Tax=Corynebacterium stationis TaxID=1705 RepID=UPI0026F1B00B|nr:XRE family transcriptional regulator [Corynebacterium stationis]
MKSLPIEPVASDIALGSRLRALRERRHFTLDQVAERTGFSKGFISRVERDLTSPSVQSLVTLCQVLGINPGQLLDSPEVSVVKFDAAPRVDLGGAGIIERLLTPRTQREIQIIHMSVEAHGHGEEEPYAMDCNIESIHVIKGSFVVKTSAEEFTLEAGDTLTFPGAEPHTWHNPTGDSAEVLWVLSGVS